VGDFLVELMKELKGYANFVDNEAVARNVLISQVSESLKKHQRAELSADMNTYVYGQKIFYVPPSLVESVSRSITEDELGKAVGAKVVKRVEAKGLSFEVPSAAKAEREIIVSAEPIRPLASRDDFSLALEEVKRLDRGLISLLIDFDSKTKSSILVYLQALRNSIKKIEVLRVEQ